MKIPTKFKLFSNEWTVDINDDRMRDMKNYGLCEYSFHKISIAETDEGKALSKGVKTDTFYHEKVHAILFEMGETDLNNNEKFVDIFAKLWRQSDETATYNDTTTKA